MASPVVVLTDAFGNPFDSNQIDAIEGTIYPVVLHISDPDHPGEYFPISAFDLSGTDANNFYIIEGTNELAFIYEPDYENSIDQDGDNIYEVTVGITDIDGDHTDQDILVNIYDDPNDNNNGEEAQRPEFVSDPFAVVPENIDDVAYVAQVDNSGPGNAEDITFAIVGGLDGDLFSIDPVSGEVFFNQSPDFENPADAGADNTYDILIEATNPQSGDSSQLDVAIIVTDENDEAPQLAPDAAVTVPENYTDLVYVAEATDADAESSMTYAIIGGADMDKLSINELTGEVSFIQTPDFDMPGDADGDNTYEIEIVATDDAGNESQIQSVTVTVEDLSDETPIIASTEHTVEFLENAYDAVYTIEASDADASDTVTFRFADDSADAGFFMIDEFSGAIYLNMPLDHENPQDEGGDNVYDLAIIASDDGGNDTEAFALSVTILNENDNVPVFDGNGVVTVAENTSGPIHTVLASDADGDALDYSVDGADAHLFAFDPTTGELSFLSPPDFENALDTDGDNIYEVVITASDDDYQSDALVLTIEVTDVTESGAPPVITSAATASVPENTTGTVYTAQAEDPDSPNVTFSITGGADAGLFVIDENTGEVSFQTSPDYDAPSDSDANNIYDVEITASDGENNTSSPLSLTIEVTNVIDGLPPVITSATSASIPENSTGAVYTALAEDPDSPNVTFSITGGADAGLFVINESTGEVSFQTSPDYEAPSDSDTNNLYDVEITASDGDNNTSSPLSLAIEVTNVIDGVPPVITSATSTSTPENSTGTIYTAQAEDPDSSNVTFSITGGADAGLFVINENTGEVSFQTSPDYEAPSDSDANNIYGVEITASDGDTVSNPLAVAIAVTNVNDNLPTMNAAVAALTVAENITGAIYTASGSDRDGDALQYALGGADALLFHLDPNTGALSFVAPPDFETPLDQGADNIYDVEITAADALHTSTATAVSITVEDVHEVVPIVPVLSAVDATASESDGVISFAITLSEAPNLPVTVSYTTVDGTASAGQDYDATAGTLTFDAGETSKLISVNLLGDNLLEGDESFSIKFQDPVGLSLESNSTTLIHTGKILDSMVSHNYSFGPPQLTLHGFGANLDSGGWYDDDRYPRQLADINGDGQADIVGFGESGVYSALSNGDGTFAATHLATSAFAKSLGWTSDNTSPQTLADVNGDGRADIVAFGPAGVFIAEAKGDGTFADATLAHDAFGAAGGWTNDDLYHRTAADVNGDGKADLVGFGAAGVYVALAHADGSFGGTTLGIAKFGADQSAGSWTDNSVTPRVLADLNHDGKADIIGFSPTGVYTSLSNGDGTFATPVLALNSFGASPNAGGWINDLAYPRTVADMNADGFADIVGFGAAGVYAALGTGDGHFGAPTFEIASFSANTGWPNQNELPRMLADLNGDHAADIVGFGSAGVWVSLAHLDHVL